jgi:hypothetical protein
MMDINELDEQHESNMQNRRATGGHPLIKDSSHKSTRSSRLNSTGNGHGGINTSFQTDISGNLKSSAAGLMLDSAFTGGEIEHRRESRSVDARNLHDFIEQSRMDEGGLRDSRVSIIKNGTRPRSTLRTDRAGTVISRHTKNYKVSFADNITNDKEKIADVFLVESFKKYNLENTHGGG